MYFCIKTHYSLQIGAKRCLPMVYSPPTIEAWSQIRPTDYSKTAPEVFARKPGSFVYSNVPMQMTWQCKATLTPVLQRCMTNAKPSRTNSHRATAPTLLHIHTLSPLSFSADPQTPLMKLIAWSSQASATDCAAAKNELKYVVQELGKSGRSLGYRTLGSIGLTTDYMKPQFMA